MYRELGSGGDEAPAHVLTPVAALDEVAATATSLIEGRGEIPEADRFSLGRDVSASLQNLGRTTQTVTAAVLRAFQSTELRVLPRLLTDVEGARRLIPAARLLIDELCLPRTAEAAWDDCVAAFQDGLPTGTCELRIAQLRELCLRRGHSWDALEHRLGGLMADRLHVAMGVGAVEADLSNVDPDAAAGLSLARRLELCRDEVGAAAKERESIVWLVYANADLRKGFLRCGPVQFFTHRLPLESIRDGCPALNTPEFDRPEELGDLFAELHFSGLPDEPHVLVRVKVPPRRIADIRAHARDLVSGLVEVASPHSQWVLLRGEAVFSDGGWWGSLGFSDPQLFERARRGYNPLDEGTGEALGALDDRFVSRLADGNEQALAALAERRWEKAVAAADDPAQRIALSMRILERALPVARGAGESLRDSCERYLMDTWSFRQLSDELFDAAYYGIHSLPGRFASGQSLRQELITNVLPSTGNLSFSFKLKAFLQRMTDLLDALPDSTMQHRMVVEAASAVSDARDTIAYLEVLDDRFRRLIARAIRQRNAVVHGAATVPAVVHTCEPFVADLGRHVVAQTIAAVSDGEELLDRLEHARAAWLRQRESLRRGTPPAEVLFTGDLRDEAS
jgi:hypothetical protein